MEIQRTITILLPPDEDVRRTLETFRAVQQNVSEVCYNEGSPLSIMQLQRAYYHTVKGSLNSQMTITAIRLVAGAYATAKRNKNPATKPFTFSRVIAMFLVGKRGRDADFRKDGTLSIWTVGGRKHIAYIVPKDFQPILSLAKEIDSLTVIERDGKLLGRVTITLEVPEPRGILPIGIDLNETNALVAVDSDGRELFISGKAIKVANTRTRKTRSRLQKRLASRKAEKRDTRGVRRVLKRLARKQRNRTRTFAQTATKQLVTWAPPDSVLVFEDLRMPQQSKKSKQRKGVRRRLGEWQYAQMLQSATNKAEERGMVVTTVNPAYTSQTCSRCGLLGDRRKHSFVCPHCGHTMHADINAAVNIRNRYTVLRSGGPLSTGPEARNSSEFAGKLTAFAGGS